jgi:riboflavin kinase/FMN adenylyltransferase
LKLTVAIGIFDGVHLGHRAIFKKCGKKAVAFSFQNKTLTTKQDFIYSTKHKVELLREIGFKEVYYVDFADYCNIDCYQFANKILQQQLGATKIVVGEGFRFGQNAAGDVDTLRDVGLEVVEVKDVKLDGERVSSTRIRELIRNGEMIEAERLLGDKYTVYGRVMKGNQLGRTLDLPTVNQFFEEEQLVPKKGVYTSEIQIDGKVYKSVTNIGSRPSVTEDVKPIAETNIFDFDGYLYGKNVKVKLCEFIREEHKYGDIEHLKYAMTRDKLYSQLS